MNSIVSNRLNNVNHEENDFDEVSLDSSDETFQYTIVPNDLIRDTSISPECRWLIIFLLSNKTGWKIKRTQIYAHVKGFIGRDKLYKIINEAIEAGYMDRIAFLKQTEKGKLKGYRYVVASSKKFKKVLRCTENQDTVDQYPDHQLTDGTDTKEVLSKELLSLENNTSLKVPEEPKAAKAADKKDDSPKSKKEKPDFSTKVREVAQKFIEILIKHEPGYKAPKNLAPFLSEVDLMIRLDNRESQMIYDVLNWALSDPFWNSHVYSKNPAKYL